ncbi:MAG: HNH endonuclease [Acidimicrobiia bacterium]
MLDTALVSRADLLAEIHGCERDVAAARARQVVVLRELMRRGQEPGAAELAALLDASARTARDLLETARRTPERSVSMERLSAGDSSFDRAAAVAFLIGAGADDETVATAEYRDIAGVERLRALQRKITRRSELEAHQQRSVRCWPSLDSAVGFIHAELTGTDWQLVTGALDSRGDRLPRDEVATAEQRRADALVALAHDWLDGRHCPTEESSSTAIVTVLVDPELASATNGEAGVTIPAGPRVGPSTLDEIMCGGAVEVVLSADSGVPLAVGPTTRVVPPKVRRFVLARDGGCVVEGCTSRYRLEVHHVIPRSQGGIHDADNLVTLCWYHHHVAVHGRGEQLDRQSPPARRRLIPARDRDP